MTKGATKSDGVNEGHKAAAIGKDQQGGLERPPGLITI
jgi:hypothetical protein